MRVCIDNEKLDKETYKPVMDKIAERIEDMIKFVDMSCDNI
jgi:predicted secreted protein